LDQAKVSSDLIDGGLVKAYAANTHNGTVRSYNEDRISIVLDLKAPKKLK
jgi:protein phosphatase PTC2/3